ncbi:NAD-dependent succinate-semialdehyde dehydrogenase [Erythrobacter sp.]|uniref:NAD-dependent succinate-semialdehyde dehydrogenase n=1 Tax=Erythrobacter sp. TaxID=1042 RepID=UPI001B0334FD|nr:NAD-dependent succinate-semialdehyde dehydrogenase [Erythrobacter sp.]MBO6526959.1 NAD-dependent succinate-semialdehyde dehydrogenase [Erythrobacter sp.]MBO6528631.1 NAD-dependent succinate-semialdehyde dehydrogenase [Erythrobacter sp.]
MNDMAQPTAAAQPMWQSVIDGVDRPARDNRQFAVTNPATGEEIARVADCSPSDAEAAIEVAHTALPAWRARTAADRGAILRRWYELMIADEDRLARLITAEMGKPLAEALGEVRYGAGYLKWYAEEAERIYGEIIPAPVDGAKAFVTREPVGVCAAITPWNFPNAMLMRKVAPALAAGCTMVAKPAEDTPLSALAAAQLALEAGVPAGVFNVVPCSRPTEVGAALTESTVVRKLSFTGSTEVGRRLLADCAGTVKRVSMELGGNAPFIVFDDADIDAAIDGAMASKYRNAGQTCVCANRFYVQRGIHDRFCERLAERVAALKVGDGAAEGTEVGPLINQAALDKVVRLLDDATSRGARLVTGGAALGGRFFEPTVLTDVAPGSAIVTEEIFGPVAPIIPFDTENEVIAAANDTPFGLAAYCYTRDLGRAWRMSDALEYGMVGLNEGIISAVSAPFGGVKQSGMGREGSRHGIEDYLEMKYIRMGGLSA